MKTRNSKPCPERIYAERSRSSRRISTQNSKLKTQNYRNGSVLALAVMSLTILAALGLGLLTVAYGVRHRSISLKNEAVAMLAAEAGYEKAIFWMSQQSDMLSALQDGIAGTNGTLQFADGDCDYNIGIYTFVGSRPVYRVASTGHSGKFDRTVDVFVLQAISGWDMGKCRVPLGGRSTAPVYYADGEIIDMPLHINKLDDSPDDKDIYIMGDPEFLQSVSMGESRYKTGGSDKYDSVMDFFDGGIYFDQPDSRITDEDAMQRKIDRLEDSTDAQYSFTPVANAAVSRPNAAVQLEFFVESDVGKVRITNNCTVRGFRQSRDWRTLDFKIEPGSGGERSERYDIYAYHLMPEDETRQTKEITDTYVTQSIGDVESEPGGQIFVEGDVVIGGDKTCHNGDQVVKGKITVIATGNIWVADSIVVDGAHDADGIPSQDNPNSLGLIAQGVVKVVDPGMSSYSYVDDEPVEPDDFGYVPIGRLDSDGGGRWVWRRVGWRWRRVWQEEEAEEYDRHLPDPMVVEAGITVGGGGWGAENVRRGSYGGRKEASGNQDDLVVRGTITEACRGVVGLVGGDGYLKHYYLDARFLEGILPGDLWLRGKFVSAPAGWHDYRSSDY